jgi:hypothetical protein
MSARTAKILDPSAGAALTSSHFIACNTEITALFEELSAQAHAIHANDMQRPETMLIAQAHSLDKIYNALASRAATNINNAPVFERCLRLALKAQSQCRSTLQTLSDVKNPVGATFVKEQNNLQVNNLAGADSLPYTF